ncbi:hypothetical protein [Cellvibrio sp. NN19]|uniref:hypothetical protein n=1 Tax=Cellvibrio chitinivorans TaxID=3102792 RepID=UPI002B40EA24|nr:hypothetical protein [Cellvibrio sp. NN19]
MRISDEQLSAFLDAELPEHEMEKIRQHISEDESLANRLAELALVDTQVANHYAQIDQRPMPAAITQLLNEEKTTADKPENVIAFPLWKRLQNQLREHAAIAASVALVIGFGAAQLLPSQNTHNNWNAIAQVLDQTPSGSEQQLDDGSQIKPRLSFINQEGNICRQFQVIENKRSAENIACNVDNQWQLAMSVYTQETIQVNEYQTASGGSVLDAALDEMMQSNAFDAEQEAAAIKNSWKSQK